MCTHPGMSYTSKEEGSITDTTVLGMPMVKIALLCCPCVTWKQGCHDLPRRQTDNVAHCWPCCCHVVQALLLGGKGANSCYLCLRHLIYGMISDYSLAGPAKRNALLLFLTLPYASAAALVCSLVIVQLQGESIHLANPRRLILWKKWTVLITLGQLNWSTLLL